MRWVKCACWKFLLSGSDPACSRGEPVPSRLGTIRQRKSPHCFYVMQSLRVRNAAKCLPSHIFPSSQIRWVKIRLVCADLGSHSYKLFLPPRSCMALTEHLRGSFKDSTQWHGRPLLAMNIKLLLPPPVENTHYVWQSIKQSAATDSPEMTPLPCHCSWP